MKRTSDISRWVLFAAAVILVLFAAQAFMSLRQKSVTVDEVVYPAVGYYHLRTGKFDLNLTNPPLMKLVTALPLLFLTPDIPEIEGIPVEWSIIEQWKFGRSFFFDNRVDADTLLIAVRLPVVALGVLLGIYVFLWSRRLYGDGAALLALFFYGLSPNILAHARLATHDLGITAFIFIAAYYFWRHVHQPSLLRLILFSIVLSAAMLTKSTAVLLIPIFLIYSFIIIFGKSDLGIWQHLPLVSQIQPSWVRGRQLLSFGITFLATGLIILLVLNMFYFFDGTFQPLSSYASAEKVINRIELDGDFHKEIIRFFWSIPVPLPSAIVQMIKFQASLLSTGNSIYFMGDVVPGGLWYLMSVAFLIKTPIPLLCLLAVALLQMVRTRNISDGEWLILVASGIIIVLFSYLKNVSVGLRYVLPMFPFLHVLASRFVRDDATLSKARRISLALLVFWYAVESVRIYPHYLAYFNQFIGGPENGYQYLADSYLDWGQDLKGLKEYLEKNDIKRIRLAYFGSADAAYYDIDYQYLPSVGLAPRKPADRWWYESGGSGSDFPPLKPVGAPLAISATLLAGIFHPGYYEELRGLEPVAQIGYSILIYDY